MFGESLSQSLRGLSYVLLVALFALYGIHNVLDLAVGFTVCVVHSHSGSAPDLGGVEEMIVQWTQFVAALCGGALFCKLGHLMFEVSQFGYVYTAVVGILATVLGVSLLLTVVLTTVVSVDIVCPLALAYYDAIVIQFFVLPRLTTAVFVIVANSFLYYKVYESNRKAKENERLGNEEKTKKFEKLIQLLRMQMKPTITLLLVGGINVIGMC